MTQPFAPDPTPASPLNLADPDSPAAHPEVVAPAVVDQMALSDGTAAAPSDGTGLSGNLPEGSEAERDAPGTT